MIKKAFFGNLVRQGRTFAGLLAIGAALATTPDRASAAADVWSGNCTPDIIQIFPNTLVARCQQTGVWYEMSYTNPARSDAYIDRIIRALEAAQLSGKAVQFRDVGVSPIGARAFDAVALNR
jgi:hypothetical protein